MKQYWHKFVKWVETAIDVRAATIAMRSRKIQEAKEIMMK
jgi:vacuolar-type H+-ATPase subunit C/Vma6